MSEAIKLRLPFPPSVNSYWRRKDNLYFLSPAGKRFRASVIAMLAGCDTLRGRLSVRLLLILPDRRERDIDNYLKGTLDALAKAKLFASDNQIDELYVVRGPVKPPGACEIEITELPNERPSQLSLLEQFELLEKMQCP